MKIENKPSEEPLREFTLCSQLTISKHSVREAWRSYESSQYVIYCSHAQFDLARGFRLVSRSQEWLPMWTPARQKRVTAIMGKYALLHYRLLAVTLKVCILELPGPRHDLF